MFDRAIASVLAGLRRVRRIERREAAEFRRWMENTENLLHLSVLVLLPLVLGVVTLLAQTVEVLPFLLFPPLASGAYALFANPQGEHASPRRFVGGLTAGALCGWLALEVTARYWYGTPAAELGVHPGAVALGVFLTGAVTWALDIEEASAFSTALLVHVTGTAQPLYVGSVLASTSLVAGVFWVWRERFYEQRARYLYGTVTADDHVLVPMRGDAADRTALFAARLAAAHEAGKVVLLGLAPEATGEPLTGTPTAEDQESRGETEQALVERLEAHATTIRDRIEVPCDVVVASGDPLRTTVETARATNCDLIVTPYEADEGGVSAYVRGVLDSPLDAVAFRSRREAARWKRALVTVSRPGDAAHAMIDFATRLAGETGEVSVCTCISREVERRRAERVLANLAETAERPVETRVARTDVEAFVRDKAGAYDVLFVGSSRDRSSASRFVSPPTFQRLEDVDCDIAIVDRSGQGGR